MQVLLVDDNIETCAAFKEFFAMLGHNVTAAYSAEQALAFAEAAQYDAIIVDIMLPDLDGYTLACRLRRLLAFRSRPRIIAISASAFDRAHPHALDAEFDAYLLKPVNMEIVEAALARSSENSRA